MSNLIAKNPGDDEKLIARANGIFEHLVYTRDLLNHHNIPFLCDAGTVLGFYRDGEVIKGDSDFDITVKYSDLNMGFFEAAKEEGFLNRRTKQANRWTQWVHNMEQWFDMTKSDTLDQFSFKIFGQKRVARQLIFGDIFILFDPKTDFINPDNFDFPEDCYVYPFAIDYKSIRFYAVKKDQIDNRATILVPHPVTRHEEIFPIPGNTEQYLEDVYGPNWSTPVSEGLHYDYKDKFNPYISMSWEAFHKIKIKNKL